METEAWNGKAAIPIVLGKDVASKPVVLDLAKAPHLLIAGSTGSGKSVCMNTLIMSLLFKFNPDDLRLIMVDPKIVEFEDYKKLPHLITPVINDAKKVPIALRWAVTEMENRYKILARAGVKKLAEFNALSRNGEPIVDSDGNVICDNNGEPLCKMPILIVIIDELAELRMQDSWKDSETYIARIAQLARAVGIHMIIATQRPSTNIITGVIKANFPARIAFKVASMIDSRTILDSPGANQLIGRGDMLISVGSEMTRVQCAFVDTPEVDAITHHIASQQSYPSAFALPEYVPENEGNGLNDIDPGSRDPLFEEAARLVVSTQQGSTSSIQRRFSIGYNRAGRIMDQLEAAGIVGPFEGSKARQVLISDEYSLEQMLK